MLFVVLSARLQIKVFCLIFLRKACFDKNILKLTPDMSPVYLKDTLQHKQAYNFKVKFRENLWWKYEISVLGKRRKLRDLEFSYI